MHEIHNSIPTHGDKAAQGSLEFILKKFELTHNLQEMDSLLEPTSITSPIIYKMFFFLSVVNNINNNNDTNNNHIMIIIIINNIYSYFQCILIFVFIIVLVSLGVN